MFEVSNDKKNGSLDSAMSCFAAASLSAILQRERELTEAAMLPSEFDQLDFLTRI
jgi:hypothetical protein